MGNYLDGYEKDFCTHCKKKRTIEGHDGCLGTLKGNIMNACCGHGEDRTAYIQYWDRTRIEGDEATKEQKRLINNYKN